MYCKHCDINIPYDTDTCPICFSTICDKEVLDNPIYPRRNSSFRFPLTYSFTRFYSLIAITFFIVLLIINLITSKEILWSIMVGAGLLYLYILLRHTIMSSYGSAGKIFVQGVVISLLILIIQYLTDSAYWAFNYIIPMILFINTLVLWCVCFIRRTRRSNYVFALMGISILNVFPIIWYFIGFTDILWPALMTLSATLITITVIVLAFGKILISEVKRLLHI